MGPKSYQIIFGTKYRYWTILGSHSVPVMASCSHNMADFHAFSIYGHLKIHVKTTKNRKKFRIFGNFENTFVTQTFRQTFGQ